jgi:hypothetical protein
MELAGQTPALLGTPPRFMAPMLVRSLSGSFKKKSYQKIKMIALILCSSKNVSVIFLDPCEGFSEERQPCNKQIVQFDFHPIPQFFLV